ncbi:MAG: phosphodiester glycosidase family protein [Ruminococcaceae bacterium]|nr:phosphodiester glycosidase family protein [Oscillospiraceae bacterium]
MKRIIPCILSAWMLLCSLPTFASTLSETETKLLINGVTYQHIERLAENGWQDIYVVQADLNEPHLSFHVLKSSEGQSYLQNTHAMAEAAGAVAAINADFFSAKRNESGRGSAIGLEITDGVLRTSPAAYEKMNALFLPKNEDTLYFSPFSYEFKVVAPSGAEDHIVVINKYDDLRGIVMYTPDWGKTTPGSGNDVIEIIVEDGIVIDKRWDHGPAEIPQNGYVLATNMTMNSFLDNELNIGDAVTIDITTAPDFNNIETAVGGGGMILVDGQVPAAFSHTISGYHPRSAVGIDKSGKIITLVAVDGRRTDAKGMTMTQLGYLMSELGCYNAMNLDGGGSTLLSMQYAGQQVVANQPSDGYKRPVTNSIGIMADVPDEPVLAAVQLNSDDSRVFIGTNRTLSLQGIDQYGRVMGALDEGSARFTVLEGDATISGNQIKPRKSGKLIVEGESGGYRDIITLEVLERPHRISLLETHINLSAGTKKQLQFIGYDEKGYKAALNAEDLTVTVVSPSVVSYAQGTVQAIKTGSSVIKASRGELTANAVVTVGDAEPATLPQNIYLPDPAQKKGEQTDNALTFTVFGNTRKPVVLFDLYLTNGVVNAMKNESKLNYFVGNQVATAALSALNDSLKTAEKFSISKTGNNTFITVNNAADKTIFSCDSAQFQKLFDELNASQGGNLFLFLNNADISASNTEIKFFKRMLTEASQKCNAVYVFSGGDKNESVMEDGVRYITTAGITENISLKPSYTSMYDIRYYLVTVNGNDVSYELKSLFQNK